MRARDPGLGTVPLRTRPKFSHGTDAKGTPLGANISPCLSTLLRLDPDATSELGIAANPAMISFPVDAEKCLLLHV